MFRGEEFATFRRSLPFHVLFVTLLKLFLGPLKNPLPCCQAGLAVGIPHLVKVQEILSLSFLLCSQTGDSFSFRGRSTTAFGLRL